MHSALGYFETPFLSITAVIADFAVKSADVRILGLEPTGAETICTRLAADGVSDLRAALAAVKEKARMLGVTALTAEISRPADAQYHLNDTPNFINPLYGGRDELRPSDFPSSTSMNNQQLALGILETQGLTAILRATDAMLKAANVELVGKEKIGAAYVTIMIRGDVAAVKAALDAGSEAVGDLGKLIASEVIARPHPELLKLLP
jgi:microcompartment protein CcmL/EutN